jgi:hypothetical protein
VSSKIINDLEGLLSEHDYKVVTSAGAIALEDEHNFIFVLTPERLLYLMIRHSSIDIDYLFVDEAHKISAKDSRSAFYYKDVDMLEQRTNKAHFIFASPNIPNPEVYLQLLSDVAAANQKDVTELRIATGFTPVSQIKYLLDFVDKRISQYNEHNGSLLKIASIPSGKTFCEVLHRLSENSQTLVYFNSKDKAVQTAIEYAMLEGKKNDPGLEVLAKEIRSQVHKVYYLADLIEKGVAYHIGYLPASIRIQIEDLYRDGKIRIVFCTSTLIEGVNLPADNLFITTYNKGRGRARMTPVDFRNLSGRVGRIEYNLYGNVFLTRLDANVETEKYMELLQKEVPEQKLSLISELKPKQKKLIVDSLLKGDIELLKQNNQSHDSYTLMRKFAIILLRDITKGRNGAVKRAFKDFLTQKDEEKIATIFKDDTVQQDDDINTSVDQTKGLSAAIRQGLQYPSIDTNGRADYQDILAFLEKLHSVFKWGRYEDSTTIGNKGRLKWYAVILRRWISGGGIGAIMVESINYATIKNDYKVRRSGQLVLYDNSIAHQNIVISDTLQAIENIILFSFANYFLKFSEAYKRIHKIEGEMPNDWYEYVEYGTTNGLSIMLQRNGFSRETSVYIREHKDEYVVTLQDGKLRLKTSLLACPSASVCKESAEIIYNIPELFVDEAEV